MARRHGKTFLDSLQLAFWLVGILFVVKAIEMLTHTDLARFGIVPRDTHGLAGVLFSPLLHGNATHLLANALPLFVLLALLFWDRKYNPAQTLAAIWIGSGIGTWLIGRGESNGQLTVHVGASSIIYGLVTYLIVAGFLLSSWRTMAIALLVGIVYGGIFYGALPQSGPISWEGHLCGAVVGAWTAHKQHG